MNDQNHLIFDIQYHTNIVFSVYFVKLKVQQIPDFLEYNKIGKDIVKKGVEP